MTLLRLSTNWKGALQGAKNAKKKGRSGGLPYCRENVELVRLGT